MKIKSESGFSMVELVVATAITGLIIGFLGTSIYQMFSVTDYGNSKLTAIHELQNAAYWFQIDGQAAKSATGGNKLVIILADDSTITYDLSDTNLQRTGGDGQMILAQNITSAAFSISNRVITMSLTSAPESRDNISENGVYQVHLRPVAEGT